MSQNLRNKLELICLIAKMKNPRARCAFLKDISRDQKFVDAIEEIAVNTVKGKLPLTRKQKGRIKNKKSIHCMASPKYSKKQKRKIVNQLGGGFWTLIIPALMSLLASKV